MSQLVTVLVETVGISLRNEEYILKWVRKSMPKQESGLKCADCQSEQGVKIYSLGSKKGVPSCSVHYSEIFRVLTHSNVRLKPIQGKCFNCHPLILNS